MLAYFSLYISTIWRMLNKGLNPLVISYLIIILPPLLGVFNSFVYFRPRYIAYRENNLDDGVLAALGNVFNIDLDYLYESSSRMSKRLSSSGKSITASISGTVISRMGSRVSSGGDDDSIEGDLTSPLFQTEDSTDEYRRESSNSSKTVTFHDTVDLEES